MQNLAVGQYFVMSIIQRHTGVQDYTCISVEVATLCLCCDEPHLSQQEVKSVKAIQLGEVL